MEWLSVKKLPTDSNWTYEVKLDGFRIEAVRTEDAVKLYSKHGKLLTSQFFPVALELEPAQEGSEEQDFSRPSNDPKALARLDMVFVTIEPPGGSDRPTGKQLLRAYPQVHDSL
jgi:hypothetical protein